MASLGLPRVTPQFQAGPRLLEGGDVQFLVNMAYSYEEIGALPGGFANAKRIDSTVAAVTFANADGDGVCLPMAIPGYMILVRNKTAHTVQVYGLANAFGAAVTVNGVASTTGVAQGTLTDVFYYCASLTEWRSFVPWSQTNLISVSSRQIKSELAVTAGAVQPTALDDVSNALLADINNSANIQWTSGGQISASDPVGVLIKTTLGYSDVQMAALFAAAALLPS